MKSKGVVVFPVEQRFGAEVLPFDDPDGMRLELIASEDSSGVRHWDEGPIPRAYALRGFHSVTLWLDEIGPTSELLLHRMGYQLAAQEENRYRFVGGHESLASTLDILHRPAQPEEPPEAAVFGAGSIHHIAFRVPTDEVQLEYQSSIREAGFEVTPVRDRKYFHSIYFREPGGVLFEIATQGPGFGVDEPVNALGESLQLPEWFEPNRTRIEQDLPPLTLRPVEKAN